MLARLFILPMVPAGDNGTSGGRTAWGSRHAMIKIHPFSCYPVKSRGIDKSTSRKTCMGKGLVVTDYKQDIWLFYFSFIRIG
jgi:hypothetical protein